MKCLLIAVPACLSVVAAASAQVEVLFAEYEFQGARMSAMRPDGTNVRTLFTLPPDQWLPLGISYDAAGQRVYWIDSAGASEVLSANLDGSGAATVANVPGFCRGIGRDATGRVFFASNTSIMRVDADGQNLVTLFTAAGTVPVFDPEVDVTNGHVYFGADNEIKRIDLDGSNLKTIVYGISNGIAIGLDVAAGYIYWIDADTISDYVGRARLDGTDFRVLIDNSPNDTSGSSGLIELLVDPAGGKLYYADELRGTISSANLDGSAVQVIYTSPAGKAPSGLSLSTGDPVAALQDCNGNGVSDAVDIAAGAADCDNNGVPDACQGACPARVFLLDQGSDAAGFSGRALGIPSQWQVFQPFDVTDGDWTIGEIGIDGYTTNYANGAAITISLFPDDGSGSLPDETTTLATSTTRLRFATNFASWVYSPLEATLTPGRYWVRIESDDPTNYGGSINLGNIGLQSRSRGVSGNFTGFQSPIALRLIQGTACAADFNNDSSVNSQDFFDFLAAFFASAPESDFNDDGAINSQDFFDFLAAFFAGC